MLSAFWSIEQTPQRHPMLMEVPLHDAPEHFFDQDKWREFARQFPSRTAALKQISKPAAAGLEWIRSEVIQDPNTADDHKDAARAQQRTADAGDALVKRFMRQLAEGAISATGVWHGSLARVTLPSDRCEGLWPNFSADRLDGKDLTLREVRVFKIETKATKAAKLLNDAIEWLTQYPNGRDELKTVVEFKTKNRFPGLTTRQFNTAYKSAYDKDRGRPKAPRGKKTK
jgi:hypothetical protein